MPLIELRKATKKDIPLLKYWDTLPHVYKATQCEWDWEKEFEKERNWCQQYIAMLDTEPIGFLQIIDPSREETQYWGTIPEPTRAIDIWIGPENALHKGYGEYMMRAAFDLCFFKTDVSKVLVDPLLSNISAHRFFKFLGFENSVLRLYNNDISSVYEYPRSKWELHRDMVQLDTKGPLTIYRNMWIIITLIVLMMFANNFPNVHLEAATLFTLLGMLAVNLIAYMQFGYKDDFKRHKRSVAFSNFLAIAGICLVMYVYSVSSNY